MPNLPGTNLCVSCVLVLHSRENLFMDIQMSGRLLPAFFLLPWTVFSQTPEIRFERIPLERGSADYRVYDVAQDSIGFLWFATSSGLLRYDGIDSRGFRPALNDSAGISSMVIWSLLAGPGGKLWTGTFDGGLDCFNAETEVFIHHRHDDGKRSSIAAGPIRAMVLDRTGGIWIGTEHAGVDRLDPSTGEFTHFTHRPGDPRGLPDDRVTALCCDSTGVVWASTVSGISAIDPRSGGATSYRHARGDMQSLSEDLVTCLLCDRAGDVWAGTSAGGLNRIVRGTSRWIRYGTRERVPRRILSDSITAIHQGPSGDFWIGTTRGVMTFDPRTGACSRYVHDMQDPNSLSADYVRMITGDRSGTIWISADQDRTGTGLAGLNKVVPKARQFIHYRITSDAGIRRPVLALFQEPGSGTLWIGAVDGLRRGTIGSGRCALVDTRDGAPGPARDIVSALCVDHAGSMWVGTWMRGFSRFDRRSGGFEEFDPAAGDTNGGRSVISITEDAPPGGAGSAAGTRLWIGLFADGLVHFSSASRAMVHFRHTPGDSASLSSNRVLATCVDRGGVLWVGTDGGGLNRFDPAAGAFIHYLHETGNPASIRSNSISAVCEDPSRGNAARRTLWLGTSTGLDRFDEGSGRATHIALLDTTTAVGVVGIQAETRLVWVATERNGLFSVDPLTGRSRNYTAEDGLHGDLCTRAMCLGPGGRLFVGAGDGFTAFVPDSLADDPVPPSVVLESLMLFDKPARTARPLWARPLIHLNYDQDFFSFRFAVLDYTNPRKNVYAYRLEGFEDRWNNAGGRNFAGYTKVDPGTYTLRVKGANSDGVWNEAGTGIDLVIDPPYWKTAWFRVAAAVMLLAVVAGAYNYRVARLLEMERLRVRIASDLHDDIGSTLSGIALATDAMNARLPLPDAERRRLADVTIAARRTSDALRDIVWLVNPGHDMLDDMLVRMKDAAAALLVGVEYAIECTEEASSSKLPMEVRRNIILVYKEILNNIVRHARARMVRIGIGADGGTFVLRVADDGVGFDPAAVSRGNGLDSLERRAQQINGSIRIESRPNGGTSVQLTVPLTHKEVAR